MANRAGAWSLLTFSVNVFGHEENCYSVWKWWQHFAGLPISIRFVVGHLCAWVKRGTVCVKCLAQEHIAVTPAWARTRIARSGGERSNHGTTEPPPMSWQINMKCGMVSSYLAIASLGFKSLITRANREIIFFQLCLNSENWKAKQNRPELLDNRRNQYCLHG